MPAMQSRDENGGLQVHGSGRGEHCTKLIALHDLFFEQEAGDALEDVPVLAQNAASHLMGAADDLLHFLVDHPGCFFAVIAALSGHAEVEEAAAPIVVVV